MKGLIWFLCIFANALVTTIMRWNGIILGGIPTALLFAGTLWLARILCKKWDEHKEIKEYKKKISTYNQQPVVGGASANNSGAVGESQWKCSCGRLHPNYESSCVCGKFKTDIINQSKPAEAFSKTDEILVEDIVTTIDQIRFCRKCGNKLLDNSKFCSKCGTKIIEEW